MEGLAVLILLFGVGGQVVNIVALVRAYRTPEWAYDRLGLARGAQRGKHWIGVFTGLGPVFGWHWLIKIRPELDRLKALENGPQARWSPPTPKAAANARGGFSRRHPRKPGDEGTVKVFASAAVGPDDTSSFSQDAWEGALTVEQSEALRFGAVMPVSRDQIENAVKTQISPFPLTQELLTGIALSGLLKSDGNAVRLSGFELSEYFLQGTAVGRLLFSFHPKANHLLMESQAHELESSVSAVREDSEYLESMAFETLESFLATLPAGVGQHLSESLAEEEVSKLEAEFLTRMFASGIAYIGFQAPRPA